MSKTLIAPIAPKLDPAKDSEAIHCVAEIITEIAIQKVDENPKLWKKAGANNDLRRDLAIGSEDTAIRNCLRGIVENGYITLRTQEGIPLAGITDVGFTCDLNWYLTSSDAQKFTENCFSFAVSIPPNLDDIAEHVSKRREQYAKQGAEKDAAGRYTLAEAASMIARGAGERESTVLTELVSAVTQGKLRVHEPGRNFPYRPTIVRTFYEEAYWNDLNAWLDSMNFRNPWRFPPPRTRPNAASDFPNATVSTSEMDQSKNAGAKKPQGQRRRDILAAIRKLGHTPDDLPPRPRNPRAWVKMDVWTELGWPKKDRGAFDSQWDAMRRAGDIAERQCQHPPS